MTKSIQQMTADEYKQYMRDNPEEIKKLDAPTGAPSLIPTGFWRNGVWVKAEAPAQTTINGVIQ